MRYSDGMLNRIAGLILLGLGLVILVSLVALPFRVPTRTVDPLVRMPQTTTESGDLRVPTIVCGPIPIVFQGRYGEDVRARTQACLKRARGRLLEAVVWGVPLIGLGAYIMLRSRAIPIPALGTVTGEQGDGSSGSSSTPG